MAFWNKTSPESTAEPVSAAAEEIKAKIKSGIAMANASELINKITDNCYDKCIGSNPEPSLTNSNQQCLQKCSEKYLQAWNIISREFVSRAEKESRQNQ
ncbi:Tim10/DDP family zinc finger-domain-containing protein [Lipomyces japonicus]|uniref:Tim10/DDP family zinc finger-domain-containing protein n=1 Tax=Lipomyces japonicus TaxID=56871 RepID=UPI0034CE81A0